MRLSASAFQHLNPPVGSLMRIPVTTRMNTPPARDISLRLKGQPGVEPPFTYREPMTRSASSATSLAMSAGSCEKSQSIWTTLSAPISSAFANPATYARPRPSLRSRWRQWTRPQPFAISSTTSPVPSGELSSTKSASSSPGWASTASDISLTFSFSLYVGITTTVFILRSP